MEADEHIGVAAAAVVEETSSLESSTKKSAAPGDGSKRGTGKTAQVVTKEHEAGWGDYFR